MRVTPRAEAALKPEVVVAAAAAAASYLFVLASVDVFNRMQVELSLTAELLRLEQSATMLFVEFVLSLDIIIST